jgi:hypothetical protein
MRRHFSRHERQVNGENSAGPRSPVPQARDDGQRCGIFSLAKRAKDAKESFGERRSLIPAKAGIHVLDLPGPRPAPGRRTV